MSDISENAKVQCCLSAALELGWKYSSATYSPGLGVVDFSFRLPDDPTPVVFSIRVDPEEWAKKFNPSDYLPAYAYVQGEMAKLDKSARETGFDPTVPRYAAPQQPS